MTDDFDNVLWAYRAVFTQTNAGGGTVLARFIANERTVIVYGTIGKDDYAADRDITGRLTDGTNVIGIVMPETPTDNEILHLPVATSTVDAGAQLEKRLVLGTGDELQIITSALVQTETLTVTIRALIRDWPPTVSIAGSGGTVTVTTTYDKVI